MLRQLFVLLNQVLRWSPKLSNRFVYNYSDTPTLMLKEVPFWFSSAIRNCYCVVLARTTHSAHSPPATQSHCIALHRALTILAGSYEILLDQVCTQICRKMKKPSDQFV